MHRKTIAALSLALATGFGTLSGASADAPPRPLPRLASHAVITDINGQITAQSNRWNRLVVMGPDDNARPADTVNTTYAVIDTARQRVIARQRTDGAIGIAAVDERRALLYMTVTTLPTRITGAGTSYHLSLWTVDLRNGRLRSHRLFYEGEQENVVAMTVDEPTGHVFVESVRPGSGTYELTMIEPGTMKMQIQSLDGIPDHLFDDATHGRVVVSEQTGVDAARVSALVAFDTRDEHHVWTHSFRYFASAYAPSTYAAFDVAYDPRTLQVYILAPGGLVTVLDIGSGRIVRQIPMGYNRSDDWHQTGFAVSFRDSRTFAAWTGGNACHIDRTDRSPARHTFITYQSQCSTSLLSVDQDTGWLIAADGTQLRIFDGSNGRLVKSSPYDMTLENGQPSSWNTAANIEVNGHCTIAFIGEVRHQNDATGALMTGAAVLMPMP